MQLLEEKQQLHNELQGMVAASTSETLKEQLKDAQETVVKLQLELTTSKVNAICIVCFIITGNIVIYSTFSVLLIIVLSCYSI